MIDLSPIRSIPRRTHSPRAWIRHHKPRLRSHVLARAAKERVQFNRRSSLKPNVLGGTSERRTLRMLLLQSSQKTAHSHGVGRRP